MWTRTLSPFRTHGMARRILPPTLLFAALSALAAPLPAQAPDTVPPARFPGAVVRVLPAVAGDYDDRLRTEQLLGTASTEGFLVRSASERIRPGDGPWEWAVVAPELDFTWNSALPFSLNDGALRAGRGANARVLAGAWLRFGPVSVLLAPELQYEQNREFDLPEFTDLARHGNSPPWYFGRRSADLPLRFGDDAATRVSPGQSAVAVRVGGASFGASAESQWWGPGIRNALVMSNNAPGFPHLFLRTASPVRTRLGTLEGRWMAGRLRQSEYFDTAAADVRALSGMALTFSPAFDRGLTVGMARTVQSLVDEPGDVAGHAADVFTRWRFGTPGDSLREARRADQLLSFFGRWVFPENGFEVYAELTRQDLPGSMVSFLDNPALSLGYTLGVQGARPIRGGDALRLQLETTYLEQTPRGLESVSLYTGPAVPQGYTNDGQVIGASIGPGASSQWAAVDYLASRWRAGVFGGRIRWDNDAFYTTARAQIVGWPFLAHDVSMFGGLRGSLDVASLRVDAEWTAGTRYNYLYQNRGQSWETADDAEDIVNHTLRLGVTPATPRRPLPARREAVPPPPMPVAFPAPADTAAPRPDSARVEPTAPVRAPGARTHRVQPGETLFGIARRYGVTVAAIRAANALPGDTIRAGQELAIPPRP